MLLSHVVNFEPSLSHSLSFVLFVVSLCFSFSLISSPPPPSLSRSRQMAAPRWALFCWRFLPVQGSLFFYTPLLPRTQSKRTDGFLSLPRDDCYCGMMLYKSSWIDCVTVQRCVFTLASLASSSFILIVYERTATRAKQRMTRSASPLLQVPSQRGSSHLNKLVWVFVSVRGCIVLVCVCVCESECVCVLL